MELLVISGESFFTGETALVNQLFEEGMQIFHLRKPASSREETKAFLATINPEHRPKVSLHHHHYIASDYGINRLHYPVKKRAETTAIELDKQNKTGSILSTSAHSIEEVNSLDSCYSYSFISPVFNSISKPGYEGFYQENFSLIRGRSCIKYIALGGINANNITRIKSLSFDGAAVLGAIWQEPKNAVYNFKELKDLCS